MTTIKIPQDRSGSGSASLLVSILLRFPEVGSVTFDPEVHSLCFTLLLRQRLAAPLFEGMKAQTLESLDAFAYLQGIHPRLIALERTSFRGVTAVQITRDAESLTREEIALLISVLRASLGDGLVVDAEGGLPEEDIAVQEQLIDEALDDLREGQQHQNLIAYREGGRVLVFNK